MPPDPKRVQAVFLAAVEAGDPAARAAVLAGQCAGDLELRERVEALLRAHDDSGSLLDNGEPHPEWAAHFPPAQDREPPTALHPSEGPGTVIGPYKLLQEIGEGGMGTVFMAEQSEPVQRKVALKIIKPGMDSRQVIARFEAERQALALMDHPNIAKVLDAGTIGSEPRTSVSGPPQPLTTVRVFERPYFVMELVKGVPITQYCDENQLTLRERLELFIPVCQAIQHAHQKGIIHRDLKPSNVMVALYDERPVPKVIDFGVAKATGPKLTEKTLFTQFGQLVGTLEYMSPEQATLNALDVDTRSDIYSLGVLLYELLTGSTPLEKNRLKETAFDEVLRIIREEDPPTPSTRLAETKDTPAIAAQRKIEPAKLTRLVRGELDWIVMKALDKDRSRRYATANDLAEDIRRHLASEPVLAGPPTAQYRLRKFVKRHQGQVLALALVLLALVTGIVGLTVGLIEAEEAWQDAVTARQGETKRAEGEHLAKVAAEKAAEAEKRANLQVEKRLQQVQTGTEILASVFKNLNPKSGLTTDESLRVVLGRRLEEAVQQLDGETMGNAVDVARLQSLLGRSLEELGHFPQAEVVLTKAEKTLETVLGADHPDTLSNKYCLVSLYMAQGKYPTAKKRCEELLKAQTARFGGTHPDTLMTKGNLAICYEFFGNCQEAEKLTKEIIEFDIAQLGADHPRTLATKNNLATIYHNQKKYLEAETLSKEVYELCQAKLGPHHPDTLFAKANLAMSTLSQGKYAAAEGPLKEALEGCTRTLAADHPATLMIKNNLAFLYHSQRKFPLAEAMYKDILRIRVSKLGPEHPETMKTKNILTWAYFDQARYGEAEALLKEVLALSVAKVGHHHLHTLQTKNFLARVYDAAGKYREAEKLLKEVEEVCVPRLETNASPELLPGYTYAFQYKAALALHAHLYATLSEWSQAAACYVKAAASPADEGGHVGFEQAAVFLLAGCDADYRRTCAQLLELHGRVWRLRGYLVARALTLAPQPAADLARAEQAGERELKGSQKSWALTASAGLHYRAGRHAQAEKLLQQCLTDYPNWDGKVLNWLWLALTYQQMGKKNDARQMLDKAGQWLDLYPAQLPVHRQGVTLHRHDWLEAQVLRREAETLILGKK